MQKGKRRKQDKKGEETAEQVFLHHETDSGIGRKRTKRKTVCIVGQPDELQTGHFKPSQRPEGTPVLSGRKKLPEIRTTAMPSRQTRSGRPDRRSVADCGIPRNGRNTAHDPDGYPDSGKIAQGWPAGFERRPDAHGKSVCLPCQNSPNRRFRKKKTVCCPTETARFQGKNRGKRRPPEKKRRCDTKNLTADVFGAVETGFLRDG